MSTHIPSSVYRIQVNKDFTLKQLIEVIPYFKDLGIEGLYCSPLFTSNSDHGYDVTNPNQLNPLLGTIEDFEALCALLKQHNMAHVIDVVPNHMGIKGKNLWWLDVLEYGPFSSFAEFFDINWEMEIDGLKGKLLLPILEASYGMALSNQLISIVWENGFWLHYQDFKLPINPLTYSLIIDIEEENENKSWWQFQEIIRQLQTIEKRDLEKQKKLKGELIAIYEKDEGIQRKIEAISLKLGGKKGDESSFDALHAILEAQYYRIAFWKVAGQEINYRRFFNINELAAIHIEKEKVLNIHHAWIFDLVATEKAQGLRIDHPDGLYDPKVYFDRLRAHNPAFIVIEKILDFKEELPLKWDVDGSVGYDFLNVLDGIFIYKKNENKFDAIYESFIEKTIDVSALLYERKKVFSRFNMSAETHFLGSLLNRISNHNRYYRDFTCEDLTHAVQEIIACFPVYRTYVSPEEGIGKEFVSKKDREVILQAVDMAKIKRPEIDISIYDFIKSILLFELEHIKEESYSLALDFLRRFQQITAPVTAKGLEDSLYYIYNRLISLNEVGGSPKYFGYSLAEFHQYNKNKQEKWPLGFLCSSTHDTKYNEDVRMRINVLSEIPTEWQEALDIWKKENVKYKKEVKGNLFPEYNTEYYIYQVMLGICPKEPSKEFLDRVWGCIFKVIKEAGVYTSWRDPHVEYESAVKDFFYSLFTAHPENRFYPLFLEMSKKVAYFGSLNCLSALVLKIGSPGIVDIYQGNECWNHSLLDPDNRRCVDFAYRKKMLSFLPQSYEGKMAHDQLKLLITKMGLNFRREHKELFLKGEYRQLQVLKEKQENIIAFMRKWEKQVAIIVTGRFYTELNMEEADCFENVSLLLPEDIEVGAFKDIFSLETYKVQTKEKQSQLSLKEIFKYTPFAILTNCFDEKTSSH